MTEFLMHEAAVVSVVDVPASTVQKVQAPKSTRPEQAPAPGDFGALVDANAQADAATTAAPRGQPRAAAAQDKAPARPSRATDPAGPNDTQAEAGAPPSDAASAPGDTSPPTGKDVGKPEASGRGPGKSASASEGETQDPSVATTDASASSDGAVNTQDAIASLIAIQPSAAPLPVPVAGQPVDGSLPTTQPGDSGAIKPLSIATAAVAGQLPLSKAGFQPADAAVANASPKAGLGEADTATPANDTGKTAAANAAAAIAAGTSPAAANANAAAAKATPGEPANVDGAGPQQATDAGATAPPVAPLTGDIGQAARSPAAAAGAVVPPAKAQTDGAKVTTTAAAEVKTSADDAEQPVSDINLAPPEIGGRIQAPRVPAAGKPSATTSPEGTTPTTTDAGAAANPAGSDPAVKPAIGQQPAATATNDAVTTDTGKPQGADEVRGPATITKPAPHEASAREPVLPTATSTTSPDQSLQVPTGLQSPQPASQTAGISTANLTATAAGPTVVVPLSALAVEIAASARSGKSRFDIRLDPAELGRIDVRIDVDRHGQMTSHLTVEKPETLAMLRQDAPQLQRALDEAGFKTGNDGLQFSLRDQSSSGQNNDNSGQGNARRLIITDEETVPAAIAGRSYGRNLSAAGGVDIRV